MQTRVLGGRGSTLAGSMARCCVRAMQHAGRSSARTRNVGCLARILVLRMIVNTRIEIHIVPLTLLQLYRPVGS